SSAVPIFASATASRSPHSRRTCSKSRPRGERVLAGVLAFGQNDSRISITYSGEGGIRTLGWLLTSARLASGYLRPLGHLSNATSLLTRHYPDGATMACFSRGIRVRA